MLPPPATIPCSTVTAKGCLPLCTENTPKEFNGVPVVSSNNISPPSALESYRKAPDEAPVDNGQPVPDPAPATAVPLPSFVMFAIVIAPPVDSVNTTSVPDTVAVMFVGEAELISAAISAAIPTAIP